MPSALALSADITTAISQQNAQVAAGQIGQPPVPKGQVFQYTMTTLGRLGKAYARLLDANLRPLTQKTVQATLQYFDAKPGEPPTRQVELQLVPGTEGEYQLNLVHDKPGRFALKIGGDDPARVYYGVEVPMQHELAPLPLPVRSMTEVAEASRGGFYREEDLKRLTESLRPKKSVFQELSSVPLLNSTPLGSVTRQEKSAPPVRPSNWNCSPALAVKVKRSCSPLAEIEPPTAFPKVIATGGATATERRTNW